MPKLFEELKRRNVIRVGAAYVVLAWLLAQVADLALDSFEAPAWVMKTILLVLALGLPVALFFAWAFELTPDGLKREKEVDRSQSITHHTGRKLDFAIIGVLVVALGWFAWDRFGNPGEPAATVTATQAGQGAASQARSIAVLPFVAMSDGSEDEYFADGLTEEILNALAQLPELLVTARTSAFSFKGQNLPVNEIAEALGVQHVVEGSVRRGGDRLRVTAQLIRAGDGFHLWSDNYDSNSSDAIAVQEDIALQIARAMEIYLDDEKLLRMRTAGLRDVDAFIEFQKGVDLYGRAHGEMDQTEGLRQANVHFERVIDRVPTAANSYVRRSDLYMHILQDQAVGVENPAVSDEDAAKAYEQVVADYSAAVRYAASPGERVTHEFNQAFVTGQWRALTGQVERVLTQKRCELGTWLPNVALMLGYAESLLEFVRHGAECDPKRSLVWFNLVRAAFWAGDAEQALAYAEEGARRAPGTWLNLALIRVLTAEGRYDEAAALIDARIRDPELALSFNILIAAHRGDTDALAPLLEQYGAQYGPSFWSLNHAAWSGERDEANAIAAAIDAWPIGPVTLLTATPWCACGAPFDLEATPNFAAKLAEGGLPWPPPSPMTFPQKNW